MPRRALLIGSETGGLLGVASDVAVMREALVAAGFDATACTGAAATRAGILAAYEQLIADTQPGDAALVYYSGHGGRTTAAGADRADAGAFSQFLVPVDFEASTEEDFRGILDVELSALLARLTKRTRNATVVLDCCHSARMSRDATLVPRAWPRSWSTGVAAHLGRLGRQGPSVGRVHVESNPDAVRLVACGPAQSAFEYTNALGTRTGVFTDSLVAALKDARGVAVTWAEVMDRVRSRVLELVPGQRADVEGPSQRVLFSLEQPARTGALGLARQDGRLVLTGGRIHGVSPGDEYLILPPGTAGATPEKAIGSARVTAVHAATSEVIVEPAPGAPTPGAGASAFPRRLRLSRRPVRVDASGHAGAALQQALSRSDLVRASTAQDGDILAVVATTSSAVTIADPTGRPFLAAAPLEEGWTGRTLRNLEALARADALRALQGGNGPARLDAPFAVSWGRVEGDAGRPLAASGETVFDGERCFVTLENRSDRTLWFSLFDVGLVGKVSLLTTSAPAGVEVGAGQRYVVGQRRGALEGLPLYWPEGVPRDGPRAEMLLVFVMDGPEDLGALRQQGMRGAGGGRLRQVVGQLGLGGTRETGGEEPDADERRYAVAHLDFLLSPERAPAGEHAEFLLDERPDVSLRSLAPRAAVAPPETVAVRLVEAVVHRNRALFGASIRVDAMVITAGAKPEEAYRVETARFPNVKDGDRLSFDNLLLYSGPVHGFLDLALWVARDAADSLALSQLLAKELNGTEVKGALTALAAVAVGAPPVAAGVAAVGAVGKLVSVGHRLLLAATGASVGVYRTSFLPHEAFGAGRHPARGLLRAQDFSLAFEVVPRS